MGTALEGFVGRVSFERSEASVSALTLAVFMGGSGALVMSLVTFMAYGRVLPMYALGGAATMVLFAATALPMVMKLAFFCAALGLSFIDLRLPFGPSSAFTVALGIALAMEQQGWRARSLTIAATWLAGVWGLLVVDALSARHLGGLRVLGQVAPLAFGLLLGVGAWLARLRVAPDDVEPQLASSPRALQAWDRLRAALRKVPEGASRVALQQVANDGAQKLVTAQRVHDELSNGFDVKLEADTRETIDALVTRCNETEDAELKAHLEQTLRVHHDVLEQLAGLKRKVERAAARASAELGWLETAAFSVELAPRTVDGLEALAGRLTSLRPSERTT